MADYKTFTHDVVVIGAGGAGLRAAIEAASSGVSVGLICKSLLGKAHTVMAEGGIAAALANVDDRDSWKVHFADTMRGGQYLNNWSMICGNDNKIVRVAMILFQIGKKFAELMICVRDFLLIRS